MLLHYFFGQLMLNAIALLFWPLMLKLMHYFSINKFSLYKDPTQPSKSYICLYLTFITDDFHVNILIGFKCKVL